MKKETKIQVRLNQEDFNKLEAASSALEMTTSEFIRDLIRSDQRGTLLSGEAAKAFVSGLCRIQSIYPDDEELNQEVRKLWRYLNL